MVNGRFYVGSLIVNVIVINLACQPLLDDSYYSRYNCRSVVLGAGLVKNGQR